MSLFDWFDIENPQKETSETAPYDRSAAVLTSST